MKSKHRQRDRATAHRRRNGLRTPLDPRQRRERLVAWITVLGVPLLVALGDMLLTGRGNLSVSALITREAGLFFLGVVAMCGWAAYAHRYPFEKWRTAAAGYGMRMRGHGGTVWGKRRVRTPSTVTTPNTTVSPADKAMVVLVLILGFIPNGYVMARQTYELIYESARSPFVLWSLATVVGLAMNGVELLIGHTERGRPWWRSHSTAFMMIAELGIVSARIFLDVADRHDTTVVRQIAENALFIVIATAGPWANRWLGPRLVDWLGGANVGGSFSGFLSAIGRVCWTVILAIVCAILSVVGWIMAVIERILAFVAWLYLAIEQFVWRLLFGGDDGGPTPPQRVERPAPGGGSGNGKLPTADAPTSDRVPSPPALLAAFAVLATTGAASGCTRHDGATSTPRERPTCVARLLGEEYKMVAPIRRTDERGDDWWFCGVDLSGSNECMALAELDACVATARTLDPTVGIWIPFITGDAWRSKDSPVLDPVKTVQWTVPALPCEPHCEPGSFRATGCARALRTWLDTETERRNETANDAMARAQSKRLAVLNEWYRTIRTEIVNLYERPYTERGWIQDGSSYREYLKKVGGRIAALRLRAPVTSVTLVTVGDFIQEHVDRRGRQALDQEALAWAKRQRGDCDHPPTPRGFDVPITSFLVRTPPSLIRHSEQRHAEQWAHAMERMLRCAGVALPLEEPLLFLDGMPLPGPTRSEQSRLAHQ